MELISCKEDHKIGRITIFGSEGMSLSRKVDPGEEIYVGKVIKRLNEQNIYNT